MTLTVSQSAGQPCNDNGSWHPPYTARATLTGYEIVDRFDFVASRIEGPNSTLLGRLLKNLNDGDVTGAVREALRASLVSPRTLNANTCAPEGTDSLPVTTTCVSPIHAYPVFTHEEGCR
jgi:hypothetical protein